MKVVLQDITLYKVFRCFFPTRHEKHHYLGITWNPYDENSHMYNVIEEFIVYVDSIARPERCPKFFLRLLHLFGNDNSICRVRNRYLSDLHHHILNNIMIMDIKTKWDEYDIRIYGHFPDNIHKRIEEIEDEFYQLSTKDPNSYKL